MLDFEKQLSDEVLIEQRNPLRTSLGKNPQFKLQSY
jgi:hypothetical protein